MNKLHTTPYLLIIGIIFFSACTEIIQIDINGSEPQVVVEASIGNRERAKVILTNSVNLYVTGGYSTIQNATVTLTDNVGNTEKLTETSLGTYITVNMKGEVGKTYKLHIETGNHIISSVCTMPQSVPVDSFRVVNSIYPGGGPSLLPSQPADFYEVYVIFTDPAIEKNYYRLVLYVNGQPSRNNYVYDDRLTDGNQVEKLLVVYDPEMKTGDNISVELQCIDKSVYDYFKSMGNSSMGPGNGSSPANPYTNLKGTNLGYFSAHTIERLQYIIE